MIYGFINNCEGKKLWKILCLVQFVNISISDLAFRFLSDQLKSNSYLQIHLFYDYDVFNFLVKINFEKLHGDTNCQGDTIVLIS